MKFVLCVAGVVLIIEGAPWFLSPAAMKKMQRQLLLSSPRALRVWGLLAMLSGLLLVRFATL